MHWDENHTENTLKTFACEVISTVGQFYYAIKSFLEASDVLYEEGSNHSGGSICPGSGTDDMLMRLSVERDRSSARRNQESNGDINGNRKTQYSNSECN
jgi:hypothetical protein